MASRKNKKKIKESDSAYLLKILLFFIMGTLWLRIANINIGPFTDISLPVGLLLGLLFAAHDHFQIDRKMEYGLLLMAAVLSFYLPMGIVI